MDKVTAGLIGAVAGLATIGCTHAATASPTPDAMQTSSYADLLAPVPNAVELLQADDAARTQPAGGVQLADYYGYGGGYDGPSDHHHHHYSRNYHHHHHHNYYSQNYGNDHHHHHYREGGNYVGIPGVGGFVVGR